MSAGGEWLDAAWLIEALIASTLLMGFVLLVRKPAQRAFGPQLAYWLWALPALRLVTPPLPANWREQTIAPIAAASETVRVLILPAAAADPASAPPESSPSRSDSAGSRPGAPRAAASRTCRSR